MALLLISTASSFGMENDLWKPQEWSNAPATDNARKNTLIVIGRELNNVLLKINNHANNIPINKYLTIVNLLNQWIYKVGVHDLIIDLEPLVFDRHAVDNLIRNYADQEMALVASVNEVENIIYNYQVEPLDAIIDSLSSISIDSANQ